MNEAGVGAAACGTEEGEGGFGSGHLVGLSSVDCMVICSWSTGFCCGEVLL